MVLKEGRMMQRRGCHPHQPSVASERSERASERSERSECKRTSEASVSERSEWSKEERSKGVCEPVSWGVEEEGRVGDVGGRG